MPQLPVVAVVNTNPDLIELLKARIEAAGFVVLIIHIADIRAGLDIGSVLTQHDPCVIVYDVVMPYERNRRFLQHLRETSFHGRRDSEDIDTVVQAVREAARARATV
jgi:CheY-like chemotaxis protein